MKVVISKKYSLGTMILGLLITCLSAAAAFQPSSLNAQSTEATKDSPFYLGLAGDYSKIGDTSASRLSFFLGRYFPSQTSLKLGVQSDLSWFNQQDLYQVGAELGIVLEWRFNEQAARPFLLIGGGINAESIGSFNIARYPLGLGPGLRFPIADKGFFQIEYKYRYIFNDPIEDFNVHQLSVGVAILLN